MITVGVTTLSSQLTTHKYKFKYAVLNNYRRESVGRGPKSALRKLAQMQTVPQDVLKVRLENH